MKVLLATCFDEAALEQLRGMADQTVSLTTDPSGSIAASPVDPAAGDSLFLTCSRASIFDHIGKHGNPAQSLRGPTTGFQYLWSLE